jgi:hypothetical protein
MAVFDGYQRSGGTYCLKIEAISSSETLVTTYKTIRHYHPEDNNPI